MFFEEVSLLSFPGTSQAHCLKAFRQQFVPSWLRQPILEGQSTNTNKNIRKVRGCSLVHARATLVVIEKKGTDSRAASA